MRTIVLFAWLAGVSIGFPAQEPGAGTLADLQRILSNHIAEARFASAAWGVKIVSLNSRETLFEFNANKLLKPASNAKMYTAALALARLGTNYSIKTSILSSSRPDADGVVIGDLIIYGRGDPGFSSRFAKEKEIFDPIVKAIAAAGVKKIAGDLVGDESYFEGPALGSGWTWDDLQYYYGAEVSALSVQDNVIDLVFKPANVPAPCTVSMIPPCELMTIVNRTRTVASGGKREISLFRPVGENVLYVNGMLPAGGPPWPDAVPVHNPGLWFVTLLKEALRKQGIEIGGKVRMSHQIPASTPEKLVEVGSVQSPLLSEIIAKTLKPSQNLYAQLLLLQVGKNSAKPAPTTEQQGLNELAIFLREARIRKEEVLLEEGSGLSRSALVTPNATVTLLQYAHYQPFGEIFKAALPIAGIDGSLKNRLKSAAGNIWAKTGSLQYVDTLSGYVKSAGGGELAFSIMLNNYLPPPGKLKGRDEIDAIALELAQFKGR